MSKVNKIESIGKLLYFDMVLFILQIGYWKVSLKIVFYNY